MLCCDLLTDVFLQGLGAVWHVFGAQLCMLFDTVCILLGTVCMFTYIAPAALPPA
eukprot:m.736870 g.736870  ORF g.736870 m.736870 type:complete len:55 (-) comp23097_c0_seq16:199-363(-)